MADTYTADTYTHKADTNTHRKPTPTRTQGRHVHAQESTHIRTRPPRDVQKRFKTDAENCQKYKHLSNGMTVLAKPQRLTRLAALASLGGSQTNKDSTYTHRMDTYKYTEGQH